MGKKIKGKKRKEIMPHITILIIVNNPIPINILRNYTFSMVSYIFVVASAQ